jgi:hypothetical protein
MTDNEKPTAENSIADDMIECEIFGSTEDGFILGADGEFIGMEEDNSQAAS